MSAHLPRTREGPSDDDYLLIVGNQVTLEDDESLATVALAAENVVLDSLWTRLRHIERSTQSPSVIFVHLDPYLSVESLETASAVKRSGNEGSFSIDLRREAIPRTLNALREVIRMSAVPGTMSSTSENKAGVDMGVSQLGFSAANHSDLKKVYDNLYESSKKMKDLKDQEKALSARVTDEDDTTKIIESLDGLESKLKECSKECQRATKTWSKRLDAFLRDIPGEEIIVQHLSEWTDFDKIFSSDHTSADRMIFRTAAMSPKHHAIVLAYHGDINLKKSVVNIESFVDSWIEARHEKHKMYCNLMTKIEKGEYAEDRPDTWPQPDRVTDYFLLTVPVDRVGDFIKKIVDTRTTIESQVQRAMQMAKQRATEKSDGDAVSSEDDGQ